MSEPKIYVLHENAAWVEPLRAAFAERDLPFAEWFLDEGRVDFERTPPEGVFYNRMSASSFTRGHRFGPELTRHTLQWLEDHGRRVVNDSRAVALEVDKLAQYRRLRAAGIRTPRTVAAVGRGEVVAAAAAFGAWPLVLKPNRGGKGHDVRRFDDLVALEEHVNSAAFEPPLDGVTLVQEYLRTPEPFITRAEFVGGRYLYAVRVNTSAGFELCPADVCQTDDAPPLFQVVPRIDACLIERLEAFLADNGIGIAGVEFATDADGRSFAYDVNTNTNYNPDAEARAGVSGMGAIADYLGAELRRLYPARVAA